MQDSHLKYRALQWNSQVLLDEGWMKVNNKFLIKYNIFILNPTGEMIQNYQIEIYVEFQFGKIPHFYC